MELRLLPPLLVLAAAYNCVFEAPDGVFYDLTPMSHTSPPDYSIQGLNFFEYRVNVCQAVYQSCAGDFTGTATQWTPQGACVAIIGRENPEFGGEEPPTLDYISKEDPSQGVILTYKNGDLCPGVVSFERQVSYVITCDKSTKGTIISANEPELCQYRIEFRSKAGCIPQLAKEQKELKKTISTLKMVGIGIVLLLAVYCVAGVYFNRRSSGTDGIVENIPHKDFWWSLPGALRSLLGLFLTKVRGWKDGYEAPSDQTSL